MARIKKGILSGFSGKVGKVVGYEIRDNAFIRSMPVRTAPFTAGELANQAKFKLVNDYLKPFKDLLRVGFKDYYTPMGGVRAAISYTLRECVVKNEEGIAINPAKIKISGGKLWPALSPSLSFETGGQLLLSWNYDPQAKGSDQLLLLVYDSARAKAFHLVFEGPLRKAEQLSFTLPTELQTGALDIYIGFIAADRTAQSDSQYLGRFELG